MSRLVHTSLWYVTHWQQTTRLLSVCHVSQWHVKSLTPLVRFVVDSLSNKNPQRIEQQVARLWQRDRATHACLASLRGGSLWGKILGWRVTVRANIYGPLDTGMLYYNFSAGSFHTNKLCSRLYSIDLKFSVIKTKKSLFEPPFGGTYALHL